MDKKGHFGHAICGTWGRERSCEQKKKKRSGGWGDCVSTQERRLCFSWVASLDGFLSFLFFLDVKNEQKDVHPLTPVDEVNRRDAVEFSEAEEKGGRDTVEG